MNQDGFQTLKKFSKMILEYLNRSIQWVLSRKDSELWGPAVHVPSDEFMLDACENHELSAIHMRMEWSGTLDEMNHLISSMVRTKKVHWDWFCQKFGSLYWMEMIESVSILLAEHHQTLLQENTIPWTCVETAQAIQYKRYDWLQWSLSRFPLQPSFCILVSITDQIRHWKAMKRKEIQLLMQIMEQCRNSKDRSPTTLPQPQSDHLFQRYDRLVPSKNQLKKWFRSIPIPSHRNHSVMKSNEKKKDSNH